MTSDISAFARIAIRDERQEEWLRRKAEAQRYVSSIGDTALWASLAGQLEREYSEKAALPPHDALLASVHTLLENLGISTSVIGHAQDEVTTTIVSGALAQFLMCADPCQERVAAAAKVEFYLDMRFVAQRIAQSEVADSWLAFLRKVTLDVHSINNDAYQASDELERWQKELTRSAPSWREGEFPHMGLSEGQLLSALLRALDEDAWIEFLDRLPIPALVEAFLWDADVERSPGSILDWIGAAPPVFDAAGKRTKSALAFILERGARALVEKQLMEGFPWGHGVPDIERTIGDAIARFDDPIRELAATIHKRPDGKELLGELSAVYFLRAQSSAPESSRGKLLSSLELRLGLSYAETLGGAAAALALARDRATSGPDRSHWGLWLVAPALASKAANPEEEEPQAVLRESWSWLVEILRARDPEIANRYSPFVQWTENLASLALCACAEPLRALEDAWRALAPQRLARQESRHAEDSWATSRFLIRSAFHCLRTGQTAVWSAAMEMALAAWFARSKPEPFDEVAYGLAHLAARKVEVAGEPANTFRYLVGEPDEVSDAVIGLVNNGFDPSRVVQAGAEAGIDAVAYLRLSSNRRRREQLEQVIQRLLGAQGTGATPTE